jgi:hypothetical protein
MAGHKGPAEGVKHKSKAPNSTFREAPQPFARLDELVCAQVRTLWWRQRRDGNRLPAEPGVILIPGGKS